MKLYNSLTREVETFEPITDMQVGMYSCGPTVYDNAHIGHMRKYVGDDVLRRVLEYFGYTVRVVMNITDVGHLVSDNDTGEDKMEKGARKHNITVWELAAQFTDQFFASTGALNIKRPEIICKATDYIPEQIDLVKTLTDKGFTYRIDDGIYFDTTKFANYGTLSDMDQINAGARVGVNEQNGMRGILHCGSFLTEMKSGKWNGRVRGEWVFPGGILSVVP
jgi:cysteinyl-tRNA synthetase